MYLLKLGGSVITQKDKMCTLRKDVLSRLVREIAEVMRKDRELIIVHGAGSFGHLRAKKAGVHLGLRDLDGEEKRIHERILAMAHVQADVRRLNLSVCEQLENVGVPCFSIAPASVGLMRGGRLVHFDMEAFRHSLGLGMVPVSFGDVLLDESMGFSICSGDQILLELAREFHPEKVIFLSDVDGIYDRDPKTHGDARLLPHLTPSDIEELSLSGKEGDVTGAMYGKMGEAVEMAKTGARVIFLNGLVEGRLPRFFEDEDSVPHTTLEEAR
ncbi:MAG: isopentenyl phosphate kinase family protein [Thermoplasmata archaeon]|nr:isopentenyl phosphate kinase family protein [Thermoplasmata archaeon]